MARMSPCAVRAVRRVIRARTWASTVGRRGAPRFALPLVLAVAEGRLTERRGRRFCFASRGLGVGVDVVELDEGGPSVEALALTDPATEAYICDSWMCVPGPGRYLVAGPSRVPGRAKLGRAIAAEWEGCVLFSQGA